MNSLRTRLFRAIALIVLLCVALTFTVGLVLTRRAVDAATLKDLSHQADLLAGQAQTGQLSPLTHLPALQPYLDRQHESYVDEHGCAAGLGAGGRQARASRADGTVTLNGQGFFFAARLVERKPFVLLRPKSS